MSVDIAKFLKLWVGVMLIGVAGIAGVGLSLMGLAILGKTHPALFVVLFCVAISLFIAITEYRTRYGWKQVGEK